MNTRQNKVDKKFFCVKLSQRTDPSAIKFVIFVASSKDVATWAGVRRVGEVEKGTQRVLKETRVKAIKRFLSANNTNTIPVSVILAFNPSVVAFNSLNTQLTECLSGTDVTNGIGSKSDWGTISFSFDPSVNEEDRPAIIVDGQHRIKGMASVDEDIPIAIAAFIDAPPQEQAFQFVVINNKAQKVKTDNVKAIIKDIDEEALQSRLRVAGVNYGKYPAMLGDIDEMSDSPFYQLLNWPINNSPSAIKAIELTTIETCLKYIKAVLPILSDDEDTLKDIFISTWRGIKEFYTGLWNIPTPPEKSKFLSKVNITALNEYVMDRLGNAWLEGHVDIYEANQVSTYTKKFVEDIPAEFWTTDWTIALQDNTIVRNKIKEDLRKIPQNIRAGREWNDGLNLIASS
jgi:DGQHR domain-containing protein